MFSFSAHKGKPAVNVLTTQTELWVTIKGSDKFKEFQKDVEKIAEETTADLKGIEKEWKKEEIEKVPFSSQAESLSTIRVGEDRYITPRKEIFLGLRGIIEEKMDKAGLKKPKSVDKKEKSCPEGEWRLNYQKGTPPQFNSLELVATIEKAAKEFGITEFDKNPVTAGSDFCFMKDKDNETAIIVWGCVDPKDYQRFKDERIGHHHPKFIETEKSVVQSSKILARTAQLFWEKTSKNSL